MSDTKIQIRVIRKETIGENLSSLIKLKITDKLSEIRKILAYDGIIRMDNSTLFLDSDSNVITPDNESKRDLKEIITNSNMENTMYLKNCEFPDLEHFKTKLSLEYGRTLTPINTEIKIAEDPAFKINRIKSVKPNVTISYETVKFNSKDTWEQKVTMFLNAEAELMNFGSLGLSFTNTQNRSNETEKNSSFNYTKISKMHLKFEDLEPTRKFIDEVKEAVESQDREELRKINKKYGQFVPTEVTLGGIVYYVNESNIYSEQKINAVGIPVIPAVELNVEVGFGIDNSISESTSSEWKYSSCIGGESQDLDSFDKKEWIKSLSDFKHWDCIEFREPIHTFQLLNYNLREKVYKILGKKILYRNVISISRQIEYGEREIVDLPLQGKICEIIKKEEADCSVFATIVGDEKNDFYNCQIYHPRKGNEKPKLIIHCYQKNQKYPPRHNLKIGFMIIGYGFDFPNDENDENDETRLVVRYQDYQNSNDQELTQFSFDQNTFLGIPVLNELNDLDISILIGHYFLKKESTIEANVFSYSLKENKYVKLPRSFRFQVLVSGISKAYESIHFRKKMNGNSIINLIDYRFEYGSILYISLLSSKKFGPVFLKQTNKQIKLKFIGKKISSDECDLRCIVFILSKSGRIAKLQKPEMSFSEFSLRLEKVIVLSEKIVKSCQSAKNHKKILEKFENKISEVLKVLKNLRNYRDHFFNQKIATLLERLINDIEKIKNLVDYISSSEKISEPKILIILKIENLFEARKFEESFDNNLVNIQRSIESSKERDNNNETQDDVPTDDDDDVSIEDQTNNNNNKTNNIRVPTDENSIFLMIYNLTRGMSSSSLYSTYSILH